MNYRHIYHAGHACDVVKHATLALMIDYLRQKEKGFAILDTHAGCGLYDLTDPRAIKTGEADTGIKKLWGRLDTTSPLLKPYADVLRALNEDGTLKLYPGSPMVARKMLRAQDRLMACELHPEDADELRRAFRRDDKQVNIHCRDGYAALKALLPFPEKRGLILIDPPFEKTDEFDTLIEAIKTIQTLLPQAMIAIWYPIKERPTIWKFHESIAALQIPKTMIAEFLFYPEVRSDRLNGTGYVIINPPWVLEEQLSAIYPTLHDAMETESKQSIIRFLS